MKIYFKSDVKHAVKLAYNEGFLQGVKYQKDRTPAQGTPRKIIIKYVS